MRNNMHNEPNILINHLYPAGTRFIITPDVKGNSFTPSSIGFVSYMTETDFDYQNVTNITAVIIRKGKGGQNRVNMYEMSIPIFTSSDMLKHENYLPVERRIYSHIESMPFDEMNLLNISPLDFLGWACAYATYLRYLALNLSYPRGVSAELWPDGPNSNILKDVYLLSERFEENPKVFLEEYGAEGYRTAFITKARELESVLIKCATLYKKGVVDAILNSAYFLKYTNEEYYKVADEKLVKNTIEFYEKSRDQIGSMIKKPSKKSGGKKRPHKNVTLEYSEGMVEPAEVRVAESEVIIAEPAEVRYEARYAEVDVGEAVKYSGTTTTTTRSS